MIFTFLATSLQFSKNIQTVSVCTQTNLSIPFTVDQYTQTQKCAMVNKGTQLSEDLVVNDTHTLTAALTLDGLPGHSWISNISEGSVSYSSSTCHPTPICSVLNLQSDSSVLKLPVSNLGLQSRCSPSKEQDLPNDVTCKSARRKR